MAGKTLQHRGPLAWTSRHRSGLRDGAVRVGLAGLALALGWHAPEANGWAAAALLASLVLDAAGRLAAARAGRDGALAARLRGPSLGLPSLVLGLGSGPGLACGTLILGVALLVRPDAFPLLGSLLAGLVAIGACARLALARIVLRVTREELDLTRP
ncbi:hypothetical protein U8607_19155 [Methylobacterium durans]|uniref:hypothetical protein n=1 Tax=Methylobacterium durans TaxID=2202825 RepID=UPI002AFFF70B|nr:hypothetical protein [Methylobacterium durans]MEA1834214.1 hypothetical protein [Methylobacterium durans]